MKITKDVEFDNIRIANKVETPADNVSLIEKLAKLPPEQRIQILDQIAATKYPDVSKEKAYEAFAKDWSLWARPDQYAPISLDKAWSTFLVLAGRGFGKLSPLHSELYSNRGWITLADLKVGDKLLDEHGEWCEVTHLHPIVTPEKSYRFYFNDGTFTDSSSDHLWSTWTCQNRKQLLRDKKFNKFPYNWVNYTKDIDLVKSVKDEYARTGTTKGIGKKFNVNPFTIKSILAGNYEFGVKKTSQEIVDTFYAGKRKTPNHCIPTTLPLNLEETNQSIHPFIAGYWLANGHKHGNAFSAHQDDIPELLEIFSSLGYECIYEPEKDKQLFKFKNSENYQILKNKFIKDNDKFIPENYLYGSVEQRKDLLSGMMTGDGGVDGASCVSYTSSRKNLADDFYWLVVSLGMKAYRDSRIPKYTYKNEILEGKLSYRVNFVPHFDVFKLNRKSKKLKFGGNQEFKRYHRMLVRYEEITPVPMRCITVDSPNHMFLIGRDLHPTSNTRIGSGWVNHLAYTGQVKRIALIGRTAGDVNRIIIKGAALDINTDIPTPTGWKKMKDLEIGDLVFDETGIPTRIKWVSEEENNRECYRIIFDDGSSVIADEEHKWESETFRYRAYKKRNYKNFNTLQKIFTTKEILDSLLVNNREKHHKQYNHSIRNSKPVQYSRKNLPIAPYLLGYWLGDGTSKSGNITTMDLDVVNKIKSLGYNVYLPQHQLENNQVELAKTYSISGILTDIKKLNLYKNKHIPEIYLQSDLEDRLELLRGLLDSDGCISMQGQVEFSNTNIHIIEGIEELIASLGIKHTRKTVLAKNRKLEKVKISINRNNLLDNYRIRFTTYLDVFSIDRKRIRIRSNISDRIDKRYIISVEKVESVPVKCIAVESASSLYLCTKSFIPTHNSGIIESAPKWFKPKHSPAYKELTWPNGVVAQFTPLDIETEVPTSEGFKLLKDIKIGDKVFTDDGSQCNVIDVKPEFMSEKCYELTFKNGARVIADHNHLWRISTVSDKAYEIRYKKYKYHMRTTQEIADNFSVPHKGRNPDLDNWVLSIKPVQYDEKELPIAPYTLGVWLGDGTHSCSHIAAIDGEVIRGIENDGYEVRRHKETITYIVQGLVTKIKNAGLYKNKHIPRIYLESSVEQRLELLRGLLDTDGSCSRRDGEIRFGNTNENLINGVVELVSSLGGWTTVSYDDTRVGDRIKIDKYTVRINKPMWNVSIRGLTDVFKIKRKLANCRERRTSDYIPVVEIKEVEPRIVKCITVDSPSHLFAVTKQYMLTKNSGEEPDALRGPQFDAAWIDEFCFIKDTLILTPNGKKCIQDIEIGDEVLTHNGVQKVLAAHSTGFNTTFTVSFSNGKTLTGTMEHPISTRKHGWMKLGFLRKGDLVDSFNGTVHVTGIHRNYSKWETFNLEVENSHTYFANDILVHNCALRYLEETMDMLKFGLRLGDKPQLLITTTPRPIPELIKLIEHKNTYTLIGSTFDNRSNLAADFIKDIEDEYADTTIGQQELYGRIISDDKNAVWNRDLIEKARINKDYIVPNMKLFYVAIDPAVTANKRSAETGISVVGLGEDGNYYVVHAEGYKVSTEKWVEIALSLYDQYNCDLIVAEVNNGGDLVKAAIEKDRPLVPIYEVNASRGKIPRAMPVLTLYERNRVKHVGRFDKLEQQMCNLNLADMKGKLVDVVDSLVWCVTALMEQNKIKKSSDYGISVGGYRNKVIDYRVY